MNYYNLITISFYNLNMDITNFINKIFISSLYKKVGKDEFGNSYYISKNNKRYVIYKGVAEASKIPPNWFLWIHNICDDIIPNSRYAWQKIHLPNLTETKYRKKLPKINKNYQSWSPK
jgi:NADH:ubiquinone oxidoreductase subunit